MPLKLAVTLALLIAPHALADLADAEREIPRLLAEHHVPAAGIGIIRDGKVRQVRVYGELRKGDPAPYDTIFNVASLTKPIVTMLTLKLVAAGKWQLDEPLAKYWVDPDVAADPRHARLTTRHVLSHQTGFANWRWEETSKKLTFRADPGTRFGYSGEGFEYLRRALERKFKQPLARLSSTYLFTPLGMPSTHHEWSSAIDASRFALWHDQNGNPAYPLEKTTTNAADDLLTTVEDYTRFGAWVVNGAGLPPTLFDEMVKPQSVMNDRASMGLGWEIHSGLAAGNYALIHSGADRGVHAVIILIPKSGQGLIILTNGDNGYQLYGPLVTAYLDAGKELMERAK